MTTQPIGAPVGLDANAVMPLQEGVNYGVKLPVLSLNSNGTTVITVTCSSPHGLSTNDQIAVEGITSSQASGFYSITVTTATAFTYEIAKPLAAQSLLTATTRVITAIVGLPYGYTQIPQVGT
jgi:aromatic ring-opening dioxygenase LigB subunit